MEKVLVTQEQATALDFLRMNSLEFNAKLYLEKTFETQRICLLELSFEEYLRALVAGYEVKLSPEEKIRNLYRSYKAEADSGDDDRIPEGQVGIEVIGFMLEILGIKIEGVNK